MPEISAQLIKDLRERTGIGMGKCKEALQEAHGDIELAIANLRKAGMASAVKKEGRETNEGMIATFESDKHIALVEVNAETDFVVRNEKFQHFALEMAKEVATTCPLTVKDFLSQKYSKDSHLTIDELRASLVQSLGENIQIRRLELFPKKKETSVAVYAHGAKLVTLVEIAGSDHMQDLAKDIAMQVAAEAPEYRSPKEVPEKILVQEKEIARAQIKNKPDHIIEKIIEGKLKAFFDQVCLINQKFIKNTDLTIEQLVEKRGQEAGKKLTVSQFLRWNVGQ